MLKFVRQRGFMGAPEYLGLIPVRHQAMALWLGALMVFYGLFVLLPEITMAEAGHSFGMIGGGTFLYFVTAVTIAPLFEEALFRGFMFAGLAGSKIGLAGTILLTNGLWTVVHFQPAVSWFNEIYGLGVLFGAGLIFTFARIRTGSLLAPVILHAAWNAVMLLVDAAYLSKL
jgi:membrane protease YdiL (CAAX protease family)